jgi:hypothetical protein
MATLSLVLLLVLLGVSSFNAVLLLQLKASYEAATLALVEKLSALVGAALSRPVERPSAPVEKLPAPVEAAPPTAAEKPDAPVEKPAMAVEVRESLISQAVTEGVFVGEQYAKQLQRDNPTEFVSSADKHREAMKAARIRLDAVGIDITDVELAQRLAAMHAVLAGTGRLAQEV